MFGQSSTVYKPFHEEVLAGNSSFTISVPRHYASSLPSRQSNETKKRDFFFSEFNVVPSFYSQRAAQFGFDAEIEQSEEVNLDLRISYVLNREELFKMEGGGEMKFSHSARVADTEIDAVLKMINLVFEMNKPESITHSLFFLDWIDAEWPFPEAERNMPQYLEMYYINATATPSDYLNFLERSVRTLKGVNNYQFPSVALRDELTLQDLRIRIHLAPLATVLFSTDTLLTQLGFTEEQFGGRGAYRKIVLENKSSNGFITLVAAGPPISGLIQGTSTTIILRALQARSESTDRVIKTDMATFMHNEELFPILKRVFDDISSESNFMVSLQYVGAEKKFQIVFPQNPNIVAVVHCDIELSERLGYGPMMRITTYLTSTPVAESSLVVDAEVRSRALAFNTGMILVTLDGAASKQTDGLEEPLLATLLPTESGTFAMRLDRMLRSFQLPTTLMENGQVQLKINLWTLVKGSKKIPLDWKVVFSAGGVLEGS